MYRTWLHPIFTSVPNYVRQSGALPMSFYAAINAMSWVKTPYIGMITYIVVWWVLWNTNAWELVRLEGEEPDKYWVLWIIRTSLYSLVLNLIPVFLSYLAILILIKISVSIKMN